MIAVAFLALSGDGFYDKSSLSNILTAFEAGLHAPRFENVDEETSTVAPTTVDLSLHPLLLRLLPHLLPLHLLPHPSLLHLLPHPPSI